MKRIGFVTAMFTFGIIALSARAFAQDAPKPTVAIADVAVMPGGWTLPPPQMGATIIELLVGNLVESQQFHVYDGQWLVPQEQAGGHVDLARLRAVAAERHVDYLVLGSVTAFSMVQTRSHGGGLVPLHTLAGGGVYSSSKSGLAVDVSFRIVDVQTGEIITTANGEGMSTRKSTGLGALGFFRGIPVPLLAGGGRSISNARDAMLDEALRHAVHNAALALSGSAPRLTAATARQSSWAR